jgi:hypothetical protein
MLLLRIAAIFTSHMQVIIGIDDTDNLESRGTGFMARQLAAHLHSCGLLKPVIVVRHQLFVSPEIPYTSHNSSASIRGELTGNINELQNELESFVFTNSASGSDAGVCLLNTDTAGNYSSVIEWGIFAKTIVLTKENAHALSESKGIFLKGLTGEKIGVIGSLAAVGLNLWGNDGRILWIEGLRETTGIFNAEDLKKKFGLGIIKTTENIEIQPQSVINITDWTRPVMQNNSVTLFVEPVKCDEYEYQSAPKQFIKDLSE